MDIETIKERCSEKSDALLDKYFGNLVKEAAVDCPETIGDYENDLPLRIEAEYRTFLKGLWDSFDFEDNRSFDELFDKEHVRNLMTEDDREDIAEAYRNAQQRTLWERLTKTNHKDVTYYKGLLKEYTRELLFCMRHDFLEEISK